MSLPSRSTSALSGVLLNAPPPEPGCPVCEEHRRTYLFVLHGLPIARCPNCGLIMVSPPSAARDLGAPGGAVVDAGGALTPTESETERQAARNYIERLKRRGVDAGPIALVAAANHPFKQEAEAAGLAVARHLSLDEILEGASLGAGYRAVVILHALEKAPAPNAVLATLRAALAPDGILLLTTPSIDSWPARFFRSHWTEWRPENRFYFKRTTIHSLLLKTGFARVWIEPEVRAYTLRHVHERALAYPRTALTAAIRLLYPLVPGPLRDHRRRITSSGMIITAAVGQLRARPLCTIVVPAFNEREGLPVIMDALLKKQLEGLDKEIILVESNSSDGTREVAGRYRDEPQVTLVLQDRARGKGDAVRAGLAMAQGDILIIQDADLEYDLDDYEALLEPLRTWRTLFVLGKRHGRSWKMRQFNHQPVLSTFVNAGHSFFTAYLNLLYGQRLVDPFTMFKVFRRDCLFGLRFEANRFDFDWELLTKLLRKGYVPIEVPVNYRSRSFKEGKKVNMVSDPLSWLWAGLKYRLIRLDPDFGT